MTEETCRMCKGTGIAVDLIDKGPCYDPIEVYVPCPQCRYESCPCCDGVRLKSPTVGD